ncbi:MAG TPA: hypothetical protein VIO61_01020 [Anaerolineaceae bacterium]
MNCHRVGGRVGCQVFHPEGHIIQPQRSERLVEVHLQTSRRWGKAGGALRVIRPCAQVLGVVAQRFLAGGGKRKAQGIRFGDGRLGVGHRQHQREAPGEGSRRAGLPVFLILAAGLAHVHVGVDQSRESHLILPSGKKREPLKGSLQ